MALAPKKIHNLTAAGAGASADLFEISRETSPGSGVWQTFRVSAAMIAAVVGAALVADAIVDGVTTVAPSQNAVFDGLALKVAKAGDTMTGPLILPDGLISATSLRFSSGGFYDLGGGTGVGFQAGVSGVNSVYTFGLSSFALSAASGTGLAAQINCTSEGSTANQIFRISTNPSAGAFQGSKARGTIAVPAACAVNDIMLQVVGRAYSGAAYTTSARIDFTLSEAAASATNVGSRIVFNTAPIGSGTLAERARFDEFGQSMGSGNVVIDANRGHVFRSLSLSTASGLTGNVTGTTFLCTDAGGGNGLITYDGTRFRRSSESGTFKRSTDVAFTLTPVISAPQQWCNGTLTANRAITLSTTGAYDGAQFRVTFNGAGAFGYTVAYGSGGGSSKTILNQFWALFEYDGTNGYWDLAASGPL